MRQLRRSRVLQSGSIWLNTGKPFSLRLRLFAFLALFAAAIILALSVSLSASGVFDTGVSEGRMLLQSDLDHIAQDAQDGYGALTLEGITLSASLTERISASLVKQGIPASKLKDHPDILTDILSGCFEPVASALGKNRASGAFVVLDATLNPKAGSRAGLFIRNMEPNAVSLSDPSLYYLRGPIALAREHGFYVMPQWEMEFSVSEGDFFGLAMDGARSGLSPTRTYYWSHSETLAGDYDEAMLLCVPMLAQDGTAIGICGFEVNDILFKMQYFPDTSVFSGAIAIFAPLTESGFLDMDGALLSGAYPPHAGGKAVVSAYRHGMSSFESGGARYVGLSEPVRMYPKNSVRNEAWVMSVAVPESELSDYAASKSRGITVLLAALFACALALAVFLSKRYLAPILRALEQIKLRSTVGAGAGVGAGVGASIGAKAGAGAGAGAGVGAGAGAGAGVGAGDAMDATGGGALGQDGGHPNGGRPNGRRQGDAGTWFAPTRIPEIDDLMDFLATQDDAREAERLELERRLAEQDEAREAERLELERRLAEQDEMREAERQELERRLAEQDEMREAERQELERRLAEQDEMREAERQELERRLAEQDEMREAERQELERRLAELDEAGAAASRRPRATPPLPSRSDYEAFLKNLATLTYTERRVFDLYRAGKRAKDMPAIMGCSANNIKYHNKNIYGKLWVSSGSELRGYIKMMEGE